MLILTSEYSRQALQGIDSVSGRGFSPTEVEFDPLFRSPAKETTLCTMISQLADLHGQLQALISYKLTNMGVKLAKLGAYCFVKGLPIPTGRSPAVL
jgi:hypothetical protein